MDVSGKLVHPVAQVSKTPNPAPTEYPGGKTDKCQTLHTQEPDRPQSTEGRPKPGTLRYHPLISHPPTPFGPGGRGRVGVTGGTVTEGCCGLRSGMSSAADTSLQRKVAPQRSETGDGQEGTGKSDLHQR